MTELSYFIAERVLHNSVNVMTRQRDELASASIRFTRMTRWTTSAAVSGLQIQPPDRVGFVSEIARGSAVADAEFFDAGHTIGSRAF